VADSAPRLAELVGRLDSDRARLVSFGDADAVGAMDLIGSDLAQLLTPP